MLPYLQAATLGEGRTDVQESEKSTLRTNPQWSDTMLLLRIPGGFRRRRRSTLTQEQAWSKVATGRKEDQRASRTSLGRRRLFLTLPPP